MRGKISGLALLAGWTCIALPALAEQTAILSQSGDGNISSISQTGSEQAYAESFIWGDHNTIEIQQDSVIASDAPGVIEVTP